MTQESRISTNEAPSLGRIRRFINPAMAWTCSSAATSPTAAAEANSPAPARTSATTASPSTTEAGRSAGAAVKVNIGTST